MKSTRRPPLDVLALVAAFVASGTMHFVRPRPFESIVPRPLPRKPELVAASGAAELACAAGLLHPRTRPVAGLVSAALLVLVFPANVQMAVDVWKRRGPVARTLVVARLPLQWPMIRIAWKTWRR